MDKSRLEIRWSPAHDNKFIAWGNGISVYEVESINEKKEKSGIRTPNESVEHLWTTSPKNWRIKCLDLHPTLKPNIVVAVGQTNGKVALATYGENTLRSFGYLTNELSPLYERQCNAVAWNPVDFNLIACGMKKYPNSPSVFVWDIYEIPTVLEPTKPITEIGEMTTTHSLGWFRDMPKCFIAGVNHKHLKIFDLRDQRKNVYKAATKAVHGVAVNSINCHNVVSHDNEKIITVWDTRNFEKPLLTLPQQAPVVKVLWSPTRHDQLGLLVKDSSSLHLYDIQQCNGEIHHTDPGFVKRSISLPITGSTSFSWHPNQENRVLVISPNEIIDHTFHDRMTINWSPKSQLIWNDGLKPLKFVRSSDKIYSTFDDITILTKRRAAAEYGVISEFSVNGEIAEDNILRKLWRWLRSSRVVLEEEPTLSEENRTPGVKTVLKLDGQKNEEMVQSKLVEKIWTDISLVRYSAKVYRSEDRDRALKLCGWDFDDDDDDDDEENETNREAKGILRITSFLETLMELEGAFARASAISVFNLNLKQAIKILNRGANKVEGSTMIALALSGYSRTELWRKLCLESETPDPYVNAMLTFLAAEDDSYEYILNEKDLAVEDRVAFALIYLSDVQLIQYLKDLTNELKEEGNLAGFFVTGASPDGIQLLKRYYEVTGDLQSSCVIALRAVSKEQFSEDPVETWITNYRVLLNSWKMWDHRARFDIVMRRLSGTEPPKQMCIVCSFCTKSLSAQHLRETVASPTAKSLENADETTSVRVNNFSCPHCLKPLPRCGVCLVSVDTFGDISNLSGFDRSFSWCQTCRHGGHVGHLIEWFQKHPTCPITSCSCKCMSSDDF